MSAAADPDMSAMPVVHIGGLRSLPQCLAPGETPQYPRTTAGEHPLAKLAESFPWTDLALTPNS